MPPNASVQPPASPERSEGEAGRLERLVGPYLNYRNEPIFEMRWLDTGQHVRIWTDGRVEGLGTNFVIENRANALWNLFVGMLIRAHSNQDAAP